MMRNWSQFIVPYEMIRVIPESAPKMVLVPYLKWNIWSPDARGQD